MIEGFCTNTGKDVFIHALCNSVGGYVHQNDVKNIGQFEQGNWPHLDWNKWTDKPCAIELFGNVKKEIILFIIWTMLTLVQQEIIKVKDLMVYYID